MAGAQYVYSEGDAAWFNTFLARCEKQSKGYIGLSLTNFTTSTVCAIAAGSVVEIDGAMFHFAAETSVLGSIATGLNYIICSVTGTTVEPYWSQDAASTYNTAKQGFYTAAERYVAGCRSDGTTYDNKWVYEEGQGATDRESGREIWPSFSVHKSGIQSDITGNEKVTWETELFDTNNDFASSTFTPMVAGKYMLVVQIYWSSIGDGNSGIVRVYKNGAQEHFIINDANGTLMCQTMTVIVDANGSTDYWEIYAEDSDANTSDISGNNDTTFWMGCRVG